MNQQIYMLSEEGIKVLAEKISENIKRSISNSDQDENLFLTIDQTAKLIDLTKPTVYGLVHQNRIPYHKKGKRLYFLKSDILQWLRSGKQDSREELSQQADEYLANNNLFNR